MLKDFRFPSLLRCIPELGLEVQLETGISAVTAGAVPHVDSRLLVTIGRVIPELMLYQFGSSLAGQPPQLFDLLDAAPFHEVVD